MLNFVVGQKSLCLSTVWLKYLPRNMPLLIQKFGRGKKSRFVSSSFRTNKIQNKKKFREPRERRGGLQLRHSILSPNNFIFYYFLVWLQRRRCFHTDIITVSDKAHNMHNIITQKFYFYFSKYINSINSRKIYRQRRKIANQSIYVLVHSITILWFQ